SAGVRPAAGRTAEPAATLDGLRELARTRGGWLVALCGALLCVLGWYGVSGERYEARQVPYLASATIPGAALIVAGAVLVVGTRRDVGADSRPAAGSGAGAGGRPGSGSGSGSGSDAAGSSDAELRVVMGQLYRLLVEPDPGDASFEAPGPAADAPWVAVPGGARYHRPECSLVRGKNGVHAVVAETVRNRNLRPCRLCDPPEQAPEPGPGPGPASGQGPEPGPGNTARQAPEQPPGQSSVRSDG
ncbi:hypothetical protein GT354_21460, partial [Streptomyces sp. SID3343]|nr:hypothetical protein [Streptomyces sp. SID3343]